MSQTIPLDFVTPLVWPENLAKTPRGRQNNLNGFPPTLTLVDALRFIEEEVQALSPTKATITSHVEYLSNERLRTKEINNPAVSLKLSISGQHFIFACDRWLLITHNLYAISATIRNLRQIAQFGTADAQQLMQPYLVQSAAPVVAQRVATGDEPWMQTLGLGATATVEDANAIYRARAKILQDDVEALMHLNAAIEQARQFFGSKG